MDILFLNDLSPKEVRIVIALTSIMICATAMAIIAFRFRKS